MTGPGMSRTSRRSRHRRRCGHCSRGCIPGRYCRRKSSLPGKCRTSRRSRHRRRCAHSSSGCRIQEVFRMSPRCRSCRSGMSRTSRHSRHRRRVSECSLARIGARCTGRSCRPFWSRHIARRHRRTRPGRIEGRRTSVCTGAFRGHPSIRWLGADPLKLRETVTFCAYTSWGISFAAQNAPKINIEKSGWIVKRQLKCTWEAGLMFSPMGVF